MIAYKTFFAVIVRLANFNVMGLLAFLRARTLAVTNCVLLWTHKDELMSHCLLQNCQIPFSNTQIFRDQILCHL